MISFVIGYAVIAWLLRYVSTHNFLPFVIYRIALAVLVVVLLLTGVLSPLPPRSALASPDHLRTRLLNGSTPRRPPSMR